MKKLTSLLLALIMLFTALTLSGCEEKKHMYYKPREFYTTHTYPVVFMATSSTNLFDLDSVSFDLKIGTHKLSWLEKSFDSPKKQYPYHNKEIGFAVYICDGKFEKVFPYSLVNLVDAENHLLIREIKEEEAFSTEYGYNKLKEYHNEAITIPSKFFENESGSFVIKLATYFKTNESYYCFEEGYVFNILIDYEKTDGNKIIITNFYER